MTRLVAMVWLTATAAVAVSVARLDEPEWTTVALAAGAAALCVWPVVSGLRRPRIRDWRDAEEAAMRWLRKAGCRRVSLTSAGADGGIDVVTASWAVQVKHTAARVGRPAIQQTVGAALALELQPAVFSTSGFTSPAIAYARDHEVALFELDLDGAARGINRSARHVGRRRW